MSFELLNDRATLCDPSVIPTVWRDGKFIQWQDATVHVMSHVLHYGSSVFEGIRCYATSDGAAIFRLTEHTARLLDSAKIYRMDVKWTPSELGDACVQLVRATHYKSCYLRPIIFRGLGPFGINPLANPVECCIAGWQ